METVKSKIYRAGDPGRADVAISVCALPEDPLAPGKNNLVLHPGLQLIG